MKHFAFALAASTLAAAAVSVPEPAQAGGRDVAAGVAAGIVGGLIVGSAISRHHDYGDYDDYDESYPAARVYVSPPAPSDCYWTRGEPVWDDENETWFRPQVRVCD